MKKMHPLHLWTLLILFIGIALRIAGIQDELSIDEIWSIAHVDARTSPWSIFTMHHDNNHYLYSLYLWLLGSKTSVLLIKLPGILSGLLLPCVMTWWARKRSIYEGLVMAILSSTSFLLISLSAFARGYAPMLLFGFLAYIVMMHHLKRPTIRTALLYGVTMSIAILWHLTVIHLFVALGILSIYKLSRSTTKKMFFMHIVLAHIVPLSVLALLYYFDIRHMEIGGGIGMTANEVPILTLSSLFGLLESGLLSTITAYVLMLALALRMERLAHTDDEWSVFIISIVLIAPMLWLIICIPPIIYIRYFIICLLMGIVIMGREITTVPRKYTTIILLLYCIGNLYSLQEYLRNNDGTHRKTFTYILSQSTPGSVPVVGSNMDLHTLMYLYAFHKRDHRNTSIWYTQHEKDDTYEPEWFLIQKPEFSYEGQEYLSEEELMQYTLQSDPLLEDSLWNVWKKNTIRPKNITSTMIKQYDADLKKLLNETHWYMYRRN
ncbi:MAG: hypothetical protein O2904_02625 [bacterium]|nr:hypothetical protein [bacterium]